MDKETQQLSLGSLPRLFLFYPQNFLNATMLIPNQHRLYITFWIWVFYHKIFDDDGMGHYILQTDLQ